MKIETASLAYLETESVFWKGMTMKGQALRGTDGRGVCPALLGEVEREVKGSGRGAVAVRDRFYLVQK